VADPARMRGADDDGEGGRVRVEHVLAQVLEAVETPL